MLTIFRINDPYRILLIAGVVFVFRWFMFFDFPALILDVRLQTLAESMTNGNLLYTDLIDNLAPLAAGFYDLLFYVFGKYAVAYHVFATIILILQAFLFNLYLIEHSAYLEKGYVPALIYCLLGSIHIEMYTISPTFLALTFLIPALGNVFAHVRERRRDSMVMFTGFYFGLAQLLYFPTFLFIGVTILFYALFTGMIPRKFFLILYGYFIPQFVVLAFFFLKGGLTEYFIYYYSQTINIPIHTNFSWIDFLKITALPLLFFVLAWTKCFNRRYFTNQQIKYQQLIFFMFVAAFLAFWVERFKSPFQLIIFVPFLTFFISHYILLIQRKLLAEIVFAAFIIILQVNVNLYVESNNDISSKKGIIVKNNPIAQVEKEQTVLVLGTDYSPYHQMKLATKFFNWHLSKNWFQNLNYYDNLTTILDAFQTDYPSIIVDQVGIFGELENKIPILKQKYNIDNELSSNTSAKVYVLK